MAVDIRAAVSCSLGTLISGNIADGYIQGNGLVLVRGAVEISGLITPAVGTAVTFTYKIKGGTRNIPRKLRVLSSFADPFRRTTQVQLGCKLTYLSDLREKLKWSAFDDPENAIDYDPADYEVIPVPTRASSMMNRCLTELGITASSNPLTNKFSAGQYDFSAGWVNVLGQLLVSEGYCGYLDRSEVLQVFALNQNGGTGPVVTASDIIDIGAINSGQLPGEAVTVSYNALRLKGEPRSQAWTKSSTSNRSTVTLSYRSSVDQSQQTVSYGVLDTATETSQFNEVTKASTGEKVNVVAYRKTERTESAAKAIGHIMVQYLEAGGFLASSQLSTITEEWYYYDSEANEIRSVKETYVSRAYGYGAASVPMVFDTPSGKEFVAVPGGTYFKEGEETETIRQGTLTKVITWRYGSWLATVGGQQAVAEGRNSFTTASQVGTYMGEVLSGKFLLGVDIRVEENTSSGQRVPSGNSYLSQQYNKDNTPKTSETELVLALGSATAQRRIELTLPMAPDDVFVKDGSNYKIIPNVAYNKAVAYGRIQNRLLLGNRSGMSLQLSALHMPEAPFSPLVVQANGLSGLYRTNGTTWTFSPEGLVVSCDALFWGAVGGTGDFWFPVAPGVTTLPTTPATSTVNVTGTDDDGNTVTIGTQTVMTASAVVAPFNETSILAPTVRAGMVVTSYPYSLAPVTTSAALMANSLLTMTGLYPKAVALTTKAKLVAAIYVPPARVSGTAVPVLGAGQVSPTSTATNDGWTLLYDNTDDEAKVEAASIPFNITVNSTAYTSVWVTSNSYITFTDAAVVYNSLSNSVPNVPKMHIGSGDFSYQRVYTKSAADVYRIRWEGNSNYAAAAGSSNRFFELIFRPALASGTQFIEVRSGNISGGTSGPFMLATASTALASGSFAANQSWVYEGNSTGTSWALYTGEHVE